jgi:hypothetical protein
MFDLRAISSLAPMDDLVFGVIAMLVAAALANLFIIPKLFSLDARAATALLVITALGLIAAVATLATEPRELYFAVLIYVVVFMLVGLAVSWRSIGWRQAALRVVGGSACMFVALFVAYAAAFMPR